MENIVENVVLLDLLFKIQLSINYISHKKKEREQKKANVHIEFYGELFSSSYDSKVLLILFYL